MAKDEEIFARDGFRCVYCGFDGSNFEGWAFLQVDHFKPTAAGGGDDPENLVTACIICHQMKGASVFETRDEAIKNIRQWWNQMREYWVKNVEPLIPHKSK